MCVCVAVRFIPTNAEGVLKNGSGVCFGGRGLKREMLVRAFSPRVTAIALSREQTNKNDLTSGKNKGKIKLTKLGRGFPAGK